MKKLALAIDELSVESFETGAEVVSDRGTVRGREIPTAPYCTVFPYCFTKPTDCPCTPVA